MDKPSEPYRRTTLPADFPDSVVVTFGWADGTRIRLDLVIDELSAPERRVFDNLADWADSVRTNHRYWTAHQCRRYERWLHRFPVMRQRHV